MADIVISFRSVNELLDCFIFTKELSPVAFDKQIQVIFNFEHFELDGSSSCESCELVNKRSQSLLLMQHIHCETSELCNIDEVVCQAKTAQPYVCQQSSNDHELNPVILCVNPNRKCVILMDAHLACCVAKYVQDDNVFRNGFWKYIKYTFGFSHVIYSAEWTDTIGDCGYLNLPYSVDVISVWPRQKIYYSWCSRICHLVRKRCQLEQNMAWLSTLGGGYSSLGDYFTYCAEKAGKISKDQLKLAIEMSDPIMASKCRVFWAQSLLQQNKLRMCKKILWNEYTFATSKGIKDVKLENMCLSVWNRLQYLYKLKRANKIIELKGLH